jgi:hypothetical protein
MVIRDAFKLGTPLQCLLDLLLDVKGLDRPRDPDLVDDVDDAGELVHDVFRLGLVKLLIDLARQSHAPLLDLDADPIGGNPSPPLQDVDRARRSRHDLLRDRREPFDPPRSALCGRFLGVARDKAGKGDNAPVCGYADVRAIDAGLEFEFVEDILLKL